MNMYIFLLGEIYMPLSVITVWPRAAHVMSFSVADV